MARLPFPANNLPKQPVPKNEVPLCPIEQHGNTYQALLSHLTLASDHFESLLSRGLSPEEILRLGSKTSSPANTTPLASHFFFSGYCLQGVPGFYQTAAGWPLIPQQRGILISVRDSHGRIQGLQIRRDNTSHRKFRWLSSINRQGGCKAENWIQEELTKLVGCTSSHIEQIENARGVPSLEMTARIANALCVSIDLFIFESLHHPEIIISTTELSFRTLTIE